MARKNRTKSKSAAAASAQEGAVTIDSLSDAPEDSCSIWEAFAPKKRLYLVAGGTALIISLIAVLGWFNSLLFVKRGLLLLAGAWQPGLIALPDTSLDVAVVLFGLAAVAGGALIHPSVGIAALVMLRPWIDGYTYAADNVYFLWGILFITVVWAVGQLLHGPRMRALLPTALLAGFVLVAAIAGIATVRFDRSFERLLLWCGYLALFVVSANALRDRRHINAVLWSLALVLAAEAIYAIMQYRHLLPFLRYQLMNDASLRIRYFGVDAFTPELIHRFNMNRAFGSTLFPNALAGFLILGIPLTLAMAVDRWRRFLPLRHALPQEVSDWRSRRYQAIGGGMLAWFVATLFCFTMLYIPTAWALTPPPWYMDPVPLSILAAIFGILPGLAVGAAYDKRGPSVCLLGIGTLVLTAIVPVQCYALWLSYSRGGMLALLVAAAVAFTLYLYGGSRSQGLRARMPRWVSPLATGCAVLLLVASLWGAVGGTRAVAQDAANLPLAGAGASADPSQTLRQEGYEVSFSDLANPATFRIRLTYWRIGFDLFLNHLASGVGLGNFEAVYPSFQRLGDPPVRDAHNGFLQAFCETGLIGGAVLAFFWMYFAVVGGLRVLAESARPKRLLLAGVYAGVLAFAAHAFIDIHFSHPGLMMFASILAGLFYALAAASGTKEVPDRPLLAWQLPALPVLIGVALIFGATLRIYLQDAAVSRANVVGIGSTQARDDRLEMLRFFLEASAFGSGEEARTAQQVYVNSARELIPDIAELSAIGTLLERRADGSFRRLDAGERVPPNAVLAVGRRAEARAKTLEMARIWGADLERADARFPHDPELAIHLSSWYRTLAERQDVENRLNFALKMTEWAETAVARSPRVADLRFHLGRAHWLLGQVKGAGQGEADYVAAVAALDEARSLLPSLPMYHAAFADYAGYLAEAYRASGMTEKAAQYDAQQAEALAEAEHIRAARIAMRLNPEG